MNLVLLGRSEQAETALRVMVDGPDGHVPDGRHWATVRAANLVWWLGKPQDAAVILDGLARPNSKAPETRAQVAERLAMQACLDAVSARCESAAEKARAALDFPALPGFHAMMASVALIMAMGALGQVDELAAVAEQALRRATTSFQASHMRFWFGAVYGRACRLPGASTNSSVRQSNWPTRPVTYLVWATRTWPCCWATPTWFEVRSRRRPGWCTKRSPACKDTPSQRVCGRQATSRWPRHTPSSGNSTRPMMPPPRRARACRPTFCSSRLPCRCPAAGRWRPAAG